MRAVSAHARLPALDGLRAFAVIAVILFHYNTKDYVPGGLFGVDLFFVLSGFLITSLLVTEWQDCGGVSLPRFYMRRLLRIAPASICFVLLYLGFVLLFAGQPVVFGLSAADAWRNVAYYLSYLYSWGLAFDQLPGSAFTHLWSLSVEEQFYLLWPGLLYGLLRGGVRAPVILCLIASLSLLSAAVPLFMDNPGFYDAYFRADYRAHSLLIGSALGICYAQGYLARAVVKSFGFRAAMLASVAYLGWVLFVLSEQGMWDRFVWAMPLVSVAAGFVVAGAAFVERGVWLHVLANPVIAYIGRRSYAIYLWHFPIGIALMGYDAGVQLLAGCSLTLVAAELSYRLVERPALNLKERFSARRAPQSAPAAPQPAPLLDAA
jgi:peptidoglycan/LPS O-acetylase OafA/YrhL